MIIILCANRICILFQSNLFAKKYVIVNEFNYGIRAERNLSNKTRNISILMIHHYVYYSVIYDNISYTLLLCNFQNCHREIKDNNCVRKSLDNFGIQIRFYGFTTNFKVTRTIPIYKVTNELENVKLFKNVEIH